jgi:hypothetical protein
MTGARLGHHHLEVRQQVAVAVEAGAEEKQSLNFLPSFVVAVAGAGAAAEEEEPYLILPPCVAVTVAVAALV